MASRQYRSNRIYNWHVFPVQLDAQVSIGSSGAPTLVTSSAVPTSSPSTNQQQSQGIKSITRLTTGVYQIQLDDNYSSMLSMQAMFTAPVTGGAVNMGSLSIGTVYQIVTLGTTTQAQWHTAGVPSGIPAAPGVVFKAATIGAGNGTVKLLGSNAAQSIQAYGASPDLMLNSQPFNQGQGGGYITFQCMGVSGTISTPTFTGSAMTAHNHDFTVIGGQAASTTNDIANYAGPLLGKEEATNATYVGANSATNGGVVAASAGTPAGTISTPTFTSTSGATDPSAGTTMYLKFLLSNSALG